MKDETTEHLKKVEVPIDRAKAVLSRYSYPDTSPTVILAGTIDQLFEHHETMLLSIRNGKLD